MYILIKFILNIILTCANLLKNIKYHMGSTNLTYKVIDKDVLIKKFSLYGLLKNLKFFEPYLLIYLTGNDLTLLQIGFLFSIREIIINVFEIPSGIIADYFGRKKELYACFLFYILSFIMFFLSSGFAGAALAMVFFGLGEAFRSGSHKAMIYSYLEQRSWEKYKTYVYGKTRSASLVGSAISSALGIVIILNVPNSGYIFLASTIPYIIDFFLVLSYPKSLDKGEEVEHMKFKQLMVAMKNNFLSNKPLQKLLVANGVFEAVLSSMKDYIQPILSTLIIGTGLVVFANISAEDNLSILLGLMYTILNILSSFASKYSFRVKDTLGGRKSLNYLYLLFILTLVVLGFTIQNTVLVCALFVLVNFWQNVRKPIFIDVIDDNMDKSQRATVLSVSAQLKSLFIIVLAPLGGYLADTFGMNVLMISFAVLMLIPFPFSKAK